MALGDHLFITSSIGNLMYLSQFIFLMTTIGITSRLFFVNSNVFSYPGIRRGIQKNR